MISVVSFYPGNVASYHLTPVTITKGGWYHHPGSVSDQLDWIQHGCFLPLPPPDMGLHGSDAHSRWSLTECQWCFKHFVAYNIGFNCLSQEEVDLVIAKGKKALGKAKPAMIRLTFHDCVGEFSRKLPISTEIVGWYWKVLCPFNIHTVYHKDEDKDPFVISAWYWFSLNLNELVWMASLTHKTRL